jgi:PAS domain-containing protein
MNQEAQYSIKEYEDRIHFLENKIKGIFDILETAAIRGGEEALALAKGFDAKQSEIIKNFHDRLRSKNDSANTYAFLQTLINSMPFPVFIKDEYSKYTVINAFEASLLGLQESEILGKGDSDFVKDEKELAIIRSSDQEVLRNKNVVELPNQRFTLTKGSYVLKTHKIPFVNPITGKVNILGISKDVTDEINLRQVLFNPYS